MPVPSVVSADGSCCTWALATATVEKEEGKTKQDERTPSSVGFFPREVVRKSGSETESDWNAWRHTHQQRLTVVLGWVCGVREEILEGIGN